MLYCLSFKCREGNVSSRASLSRILPVPGFFILNQSHSSKTSHFAMTTACADSVTCCFKQKGEAFSFFSLSHHWCLLQRVLSGKCKTEKTEDIYTKNVILIFESLRWKNVGMYIHLSPVLRRPQNITDQTREVRAEVKEQYRKTYPNLWTSHEQKWE